MILIGDVRVCGPGVGEVIAQCKFVYRKSHMQFSLGFNSDLRVRRQHTNTVFPLCVCVCVCVCLFVCLCLRAQVHPYIHNIFGRVCIYVCMYICMHVYTRIYIYIYIYIHTHTHTHTQKLKFTQNRPRSPRRGVDLQLYSFFILDSRCGGWSTQHPSRFTPAKDPVPFVQEARGSTGPVWTNAENLAPTGILYPELQEIHKNVVRCDINFIS